jgi:hypothetical protein
MASLEREIFDQIAQERAAAAAERNELVRLQQEIAALSQEDRAEFERRLAEARKPPGVFEIAAGAAAMIVLPFLILVATWSYGEGNRFMQVGGLVLSSLWALMVLAFCVDTIRRFKARDCKEKGIA